MTSGLGGKRYAFPLALAGLFSVVLVYCFGLLIGIMQYQSRINSTQNGLTTGQVIFFLDIEDKIFSTIQDLTSGAKNLTEVNTQYQQLSEEITFRISRVCSLLLNKDDDQWARDYVKCDAFLRRIPLKTNVDNQTSLLPAKGAPAPIEPEIAHNGPSNLVSRATGDTNKRCVLDPPPLR